MTLIIRNFKGKTYPNVIMTVPNKKGGHRKLDSGVIFNPCKDFLCPPETRIQEWFPTELQARLRAQALDPYGLLSGHWDHDTTTFRCDNENCHVKFSIRRVDPDPEGNIFGIYGCRSHQHPLARKNKSEIIFKNRAEAMEFFNKNLKKKYTRVASGMHKNLATKDYCNYSCRRKSLKSYGKANCKSKFSIIQSMPRVKDILEGDDRPHSLRGMFYHCHKSLQF